MSKDFFLISKKRITSDICCQITYMQTYSVSSLPCCQFLWLITATKLHEVKRKKTATTTNIKNRSQCYSHVLFFHHRESVCLHVVVTIIIILFVVTLGLMREIRQETLRNTELWLSSYTPHPVPSAIRKMPSGYLWSLILNLSLLW